MQPSFFERLARRLESRPPRRAEAGSYGAEAAVALCLRAAAGGPELLFVRRAEFDGDPWSGHVAFPGGRRDPDDDSLWATAVRETREETGLDLGAVGRLLGQLDDVHPRTPVLPSIAVTPFVVVVPDDAAARPGPEVTGVVWIPISELRRPERRASVRVLRREYPSIRYEEYEIWGLTHGIVRQFLELTSEDG